MIPESAKINDDQEIAGAPGETKKATEGAEGCQQRETRSLWPEWPPNIEAVLHV